MNHNTRDRPEGMKAAIRKKTNRLLRGVRSRRQALKTATVRKPGENRILFSMHELWRMLWGPHEASPK